MSWFLNGFLAFFLSATNLFIPNLWAQSIPIQLTVTPSNAGGIYTNPSQPNAVPVVYYPAVNPTGDNFLDPALGYSTIFTPSATSGAGNQLNFSIKANLPVADSGKAWVLMVRPNASGSATGTVQAPLVAISSPEASFPRIGGVTQSPVYGFQLLPAGTGAWDVVFNLGLFAQSVCDENVTSGATISGCNGSAIQTSSAMTLEFLLAQVAVTLPANVANGNVLFSDLQAVTASISTTFQVRFATAEITDITAAQCPGLSNVYLPRNNAVSIEGGVFTSTAPIVNTSTQAPLHELIVVAKLGSGANVASNFTSGNDVLGRLTWGTRQNVSGFNNTTLSQDNAYEMRFLIRDAAGFVSPFNGACSTANCCISGVRTADIEGFLKSNRCFIATAVFESENAAPVVWLRNFRNQILLKSDLGRTLVRQYYRHSPEASRWLKANPVFRFTTRVLLTPFVGGAWFFSVIDGGVSDAEASELIAQSSSYIERLKRTMPADISGPEDYENYTDRVLKKDNSDEPIISPSESYSERLRRTDPENQQKSEESYTEVLRKRILSEDQGDFKSPIQSVYDGTSELKQRKIGKVKHAAGIRIGASMDHSIKVRGQDLNNSAKSIYGDNYHPDLQFFYEYQFLQSSSFGNLGIGLGAGLVYFNQKGRYQVPLINPVTSQPFSSQSDTTLKFYVVPVSTHLVYRLQSFKYVVPFVYGGPTSVFYQERRTDSHDAKKGYSLGSMWGLGAAIQLNWMFPKSTWDLYSSSGAHLLYLTFDYRNTQTPNEPVEFNMTGMTAGLTYAF